jgi:hypothetical protein
MDFLVIWWVRFDASNFQSKEGLLANLTSRRVLISHDEENIYAE